MDTAPKASPVPGLHMARERLALLADYTNRLGLATYDPFDIKSTPVAIWTYKKPSVARATVRRALYGIELFFPVALRRAMGIKKRPTAGKLSQLDNVGL